jgi:hypothetical protein
MLIQLENTSQENIIKLLQFAKQNQINLSLVDSDTNYTLPGKFLSQKELTKIIVTSRKSGTVSMQEAHKLIRNSGNAN